MFRVRYEFVIVTSVVTFALILVFLSITGCKDGRGLYIAGQLALASETVGTHKPGGGSGEPVSTPTPEPSPTPEGTPVATPTPVPTPEDEEPIHACGDDDSPSTAAYLCYGEGQAYTFEGECISDDEAAFYFGTVDPGQHVLVCNVNTNGSTTLCIPYQDLVDRLTDDNPYDYNGPCLENSL